MPTSASKVAVFMEASMTSTAAVPAGPTATVGRRGAPGQGLNRSPKTGSHTCEASATCYKHPTPQATGSVQRHRNLVLLLSHPTGCRSGPSPCGADTRISRQIDSVYNRPAAAHSHRRTRTPRNEDAARMKGFEPPHRRRSVPSAPPANHLEGTHRSPAGPRSCRRG